MDDPVDPHAPVVATITQLMYNYLIRSMVDLYGKLVVEPVLRWILLAWFPLVPSRN